MAKALFRSYLPGLVLLICGSAAHSQSNRVPIEPRAPTPADFYYPVPANRITSLPRSATENDIHSKVLKFTDGFTMDYGRAHGVELTWRLTYRIYPQCRGAFYHNFEVAVGGQSNPVKLSCTRQ